MSKKNSLILLIVMLVLSVVKVNATVITSEDVPVDTYIIGSHMLRHRDYIESNNYDGKLTTKIIMLSSKTIYSDDIDDMIIYYKNPLGVWWDGETGEEIQAPESFRVDYIDLKRYAPTLMICQVDDEEGIDCGDYDVFIYNVDEYTKIEDGKTIYYLDAMLFGVNDDDYYYEISEKIGDTYEVLTKDENNLVRVELAKDEERTFVARYYTLDENNNRIYSEYSNEVVLSGLDVETYTVSFDYADGETEVQTQTVISGKTAVEPLLPVREGYTFIEWQLNGEAFDFDTPITESITLVAKYTSDITTPVLTATDGDNDYVHTLKINNYSDYCSLDQCDGSDSDEYDVGGFELYVKDGDKIYEDTKFSSYDVTIEPNTKQTYVARIYRIGSNDKRIYSEYSNEITFDTTYSAPTLTCDITSFNEGYYNYICLVNSNDYKISGEGDETVYYPQYYELYRKNNIGNYDRIDGKNINQTISISVEAGTKKTFAARVYTKNSENRDIFSDYSDELSIDWTTYSASSIEIPTFGDESSQRKSPLHYDDNSEGFLADLHATWEHYRTKICDSEQDECYVDIVTDFEWYLKNDSSDTSFYDGGYGDTVSLTIPEGQKKTVYARVYAKDSHNEKVYGEKSNELEIDLSNPVYTFEVLDYEDDDTKLEVRAYINNYEVNINKLVIDENDISSSNNDSFIVDKALVENLDELSIKLSDTKTVNATKKTN